MKKIIKLIALNIISINSVYATTDFYVGNHNTESYVACQSEGNITAVVRKSYTGSPPIIWKLYKDGSLLQEKTTNPPFNVSGTAQTSFSIPVTIPNINGDYYISTKSGGLGIITQSETTNHISIFGVNNWWGNIPAFSISANHSQFFDPYGTPSEFAPTISDIYSVKKNEPIILNGKLSCGFDGQDFFVSIQLSDKWLNRYGYEAMGWFKRNNNNGQYGGIGNFNLKKFAENNWFNFDSGQYYRVKLAFGNPWRETTRLLRITQ